MKIYNILGMATYTATDFYKDELNRLNEKQKNANSILDSQARLAKLNESYRKRYAKYVQILMVLILSYIVYLGVILLQKTFPVIPQILVDVVIMLIIFLVAYYLFTAYWELTSRSAINYDEIELPGYDSSGVNVSSLEARGQIFAAKYAANTCIGNDCCPEGYVYDADKNKCVPAPAPTTPTTTTTPSTATTTPTPTTPSTATTTMPSMITPTMPSTTATVASGTRLGGAGSLSRVGFTVLGREVDKQNEVNKGVISSAESTSLQYSFV